MSRRTQCPYCDKWYNPTSGHLSCPKCAAELASVKESLARRELNKCRTILASTGAYDTPKKP